MATQPSFQIPSVQWHIFKPFHLEYHMHVFLTIGPGDKEKHTRLFVVRADFVRYLFHYGWSKNIQYLWKIAIYKYKLAYGFRVSNRILSWTWYPSSQPSSFCREISQNSHTAQLCASMRWWVKSLKIVSKIKLEFKLSKAGLM